MQKMQTGFHNEFNRFRVLMSESERDDFQLIWKDRYPILNEKTSATSFDAHYIYHTAWAARKLQENNITQHVDISSSLYFASIVSAFIPIQFYDFRPAKMKLSHLGTGKADLLKLQFEDNSIFSLSCMHVVEHIGLGRYGDPLDPEGDLKAIYELYRVIKPGGLLLFVVPVGKPKICFNAHRIYDPQKVLSYFPAMEISEFSCVFDSGEFHLKVDPVICKTQDCACGMYFLRKK
jgi:SAM-dependent methyltransferase